MLAIYYTLYITLLQDRFFFFLMSPTLPEWDYCFIKLFAVCQIPHRMSS